MGGKSATTTQQVQIPPEVMARYRAVNTRAEQAASQPFQAYSQDPSAFVAPLTQTQQAGIQNINQAAGMTQPYFNTAAGLTMSGAQGVGPLTQQQIQYYQNPFTQSVVGSTLAALQQQQGQQLSQQQAEAIKAGAFGGDRAGIQRAQLQGQQGLATAQAISPLLAQGYQQGVQTAAGQQGVAAQDLQRQLAAGQQLGGLGVAGQQAALAGAQAQLGAGTAEQQTQQAGLSALYNQFLQERGYPFQTAQFLANIAMGTGALSGSTTTTQQPIPFFSDEREKTNVQPLGKGLYAYDYKDDVRRAEEEGRPMPPKRVGPMAQDIEERAPGLVGEVGGHKVVKGLSPESMGGAVLDLSPGEYRERFAPGGLVGADDIRAILSAQQQAFAPFAQSGLYGGNPQQGGAGKPGYIPGMALPTPKLMTAGAAPRAPQSMASEFMRGAENVRDFGKTASELYEGAEKGFGKLKTFAGYAEGGGVDKDDPMGSYGAQGADIGIPTEQPDVKPIEAAKPPSSQPKSVMSDIMDVAKTAASIYAMSDERMKSGMEQVGELYNGLPVYKYRMGDGPPQIGLSAQEAGGLHPEAVMQGDDGLLRLNYDRATRAYGGGLDPRQGYADGGSPDPALVRSESGGRWDAQNDEVGAGGLRGHFGRVQFGQARLQDAMRAGAIPEGTTPQQFMDSPDLQKAAERWHFGDISNRIASQGLDRAIGTNIAGIPVTQQGLINVAHLGGSEGLRKFVESGGRYNPADANGTRLSDYLKMGASGSSEGLMAYAGQPQQGEGAGAINRAAGAPAGLGRVAPASPTAQQPAAREGLTSMLPSRRDPRTGEESTDWKRIIIPALSGLGAMASSPSLFAGSAILQGLGAGAKSYADLEKQQADIGFREAETFKAAQEGANLSTRQVGNVIMVRLANGQEVPIWEWIRSRQPVLGGQFGMAAAEKAAERYMQGQGPEKLATAPGAAPGIPGATSGTPGAGAGAPEAGGVRQGALDLAPTPAAPAVFGRRSEALVEKELEASLGPNPDVARKVSTDYANSAAAGGRAATEAAPTMNEMVLNVSKTVAGKGFDAPGTAYAARAQLAGAANTIARALGYQGPAFSDTDTRQALQEKFNNVQGLAMASAGGQESLGALRAMVEALPRTDMPPDAQAQIAAQLLMLNQKAKDRDRHRVAYGERSMQSFTAANTAFGDDNPDTRYLQEMSLLKSAIRNDPKAIDILTSGRATPAQVEEYFKELSRKTGVQYTPGISRYFVPAGG
jgi:hypothetical protein